MKHIGEFINLGSIEVAREEKRSENTINPLSAKLVEMVFAKFYIHCRGADALFADEKRLKAEKTQWYVTFSRENLTTPSQIHKALLKLERHRYPNPPQLGEFLAWNEVTISDLGLLTKEQAFNLSSEFMREGYIADLSDIQKKILKHVIQECEPFFLKNNPMSKTQPVFYRNYEISVRDFISGKNLEHKNKAIEDKSAETKEIEKQKVIAKDFSHLKGYEKNMPEIRRILGMNPDGTVNKQ